MNTEEKMYEAEKIKNCFKAIPNWESPITQIYKEIEQNHIKNTEETMMLEVRQQIGFDINKEKLIKALEYSKDSYYEGFNAAKSTYEEKLKQAVDEITDQGAYYHEVAGDVDYVKGISFCLRVLNKYFYPDKIDKEKNHEIHL